MPDWLDSAVAGTVIGADLLSGVDTAPFDVHVEAARSFVEERRPDLFVVTVVDDEEVATFTPPAHVVTAAAMLAYRTYQNRTVPEAELGTSDDLRAMLRIGKSRGLRFGGAAPVVPVEVA